MCFGCSKEPSHQDGSFEYPQHMFWFINKKNNFQLHTLIVGPVITCDIYICFNSTCTLNETIIISTLIEKKSDILLFKLH